MRQKLIQTVVTNMPVGVLAGDDPCRRTYGVQGSCPVRAWTHALRR